MSGMEESWLESVLLVQLNEGVGIPKIVQVNTAVSDWFTTNDDGLRETRGGSIIKIVHKLNLIMKMFGMQICNV